MTGAEGAFLSTILPALISAGGAAISTFGLPEGTVVEGFGGETIKSAFTDVTQAVQDELANTRALRDRPISIPTVPGFEGISGDLRVAGLPSGTVGLFPNVEQVAGAPITFGAVPGIPDAAGATGDGGNGTGGTGGGGGGPEGGEGSAGGGPGRTGGPGGGPIGRTDPGEVSPLPPPLSLSVNQPFGGAEGSGLVFGNDQDQQSALDQIAMTIKKLTAFKSGVGAQAGVR